MDAIRDGVVKTNRAKSVRQIPVQTIVLCVGCVKRKRDIQPVKKLDKQTFSWYNGSNVTNLKGFIDV